MGTANPMPANASSPSGVASETTMPMTRPCASSSGPPELPGLTDASNWMRPENLPWSVSAVRSRPEITPADTLSVRPSGLPMATTDAPTSAPPPRLAGTTTWGSFAGVSVAMSSFGLAAATVAFAVVPSANVTVMLPPPAMT